MKLLLIDIGNTHTHVGLASREKIRARSQFPTSYWAAGRAPRLLSRALGARHRGAQQTEGAAAVVFCSVVPAATRIAKKVFRAMKLGTFELTHESVPELGIQYPRPETIGPDRLANALACLHHFGAPSVAVDFGTAVTFDVVDAHGSYVGGIIGPGLSILSEYLHDRTALLPRIRLREVSSIIGKSTEEAMLIGAVRGYRGLVRELLAELKKELGVQTLPVLATGGDAALITAGMKEITRVESSLTLEGLRLAWMKSLYSTGSSSA